MIKKILDFLKEEWLFFIFIILLYIGLTYEFPYSIYAPGGHIVMSDRVEGVGTYKEEGSLSMTYVSIVKGTAPFLVLSKIIPNWDVVATDKLTYDETDLKETLEIDKIYMKEAISNAEYVAYTKAGIDFKETAVHNIVTNKSKDAKTTIHHGDEIIGFDGEEYSDLKSFQNYISAKKANDEVAIDYMQGGKKKTEVVTLIEIDGVTKVGLGIATVSEFETDFDIEVKTKPSESGPSGGFITALEIYNKITEEDITHGKKIMGTGTIDRDGTVGEIGGVKYKLLGAYKDGAEVFLCPKENYEEALEVKEENDMDIVLIGVGTFDEGLNKLKNI